MTFSYLTKKTALMAGLTVAMLGGVVGCVVAPYDYDNRPVYRDGGSQQASSASQRLHQDLRRNGYDVISITPGSYRGNQILTALATKNNQLYELRYSYPSLKRISAVKKNWNDGYDKRQNHKGQGKHRNDRDSDYRNNRRGDDVEDRIKQERRYPAIKQQAIRKVTAMGYRVNEIELEEKNNRGIFEIEAKRGGQEYDIQLSYPDLAVLKVKKD